MPKEFEELVSKISSSLKGKINPRTKKPYKEDEVYAIATAQWKRMGHKPDGKEWKYCFSGLELKEDGKDFYVEGFLSNEEFDGEGDRFLNQENIVWQLNNNNVAKLGSLHHEYEDNHPLTILNKAELIDGKTWVSVKLNNQHPKFESAVKEVQNKAINGFSLEHIPLLWFPNETYKETLKGPRGRDIIETEIYGYGLASKPINQDAQITNYYYKEFLDDSNIKIGGDLNTQEIKQMAETNVIEKKEEVKLSDAELKEIAEFKQYKEMKAKEGREKEIKEIAVKAMIEEKEKSSLPVINPGMQTNAQPVELKEIMDYKSSISEHKRYDPVSLDIQWKAANKLFNAFPEMGLRSGILSHKEVKEFTPYNMIEYKATLTKAAGGDSASVYYQAIAELNDVYDPVIHNTINDQAVAINLIPEEDGAGTQMIQFRDLTSGLTAGGYRAGLLTTDLATSTMTIKKHEQDYCNYAVRFAMENQIIESAKGRGGIGDIFGMYAQRSAIELVKTQNVDFLTGATGTYNGTSDRYLLGARLICASTGTIYGRDKSVNAHLAGTTTAVGSVDLTIAHIRTSIRTVVVNGASVGNLIVVTSPFQADRIKAILWNSYRAIPTANVFGFVGVSNIDGVNVFADPQLTADYLYLFDTDSMKRRTQVRPTITEMGITGDQREAFIKTYFNFYCWACNRQYLYTGFTTS